MGSWGECEVFCFVIVSVWLSFEFRSCEGCNYNIVTVAIVIATAIGVKKPAVAAALVEFVGVPAGAATGDAAGDATSKRDSVPVGQKWVIERPFNG